MTTSRPSLELLRELSDEHVLRALMSHGRQTRAELAVTTGISKPTVAESVRRLEAAGVVADTGARTTGPGRAGSYYALAPAAGAAMVVMIAPDHAVVELVDAEGAVLGEWRRSLPRPAWPKEVAAALRKVCGEALDSTSTPVRLAVVSAADPVDRTTGRLVHLPDAPFLLGELDPAAELSALVPGPVLVDNDVNWAARAERAHAPEGFDDFVYLYLGEGLGCAVVGDGEVRRGHRGLAGEIAHLVTTGPGGRAVPFIDLFAVLGLRREGTTAIDVGALLAQVSGTGASRVRGHLARGVAGIISAVVALADPSVVVLSGPWGLEPRILDAVREAVERLPRPVPLVPAQVTVVAPLVGARAEAVERLRASIVAYRSRDEASAKQ